MAPKLRITRGAHARLLRFQEPWQRQRGDRLAQSDVIDLALESVERHGDAFIEEAGCRPWSAAEIERFLQELPPFGGPSDLSQDIDSRVYGAAHEV